MEEKKERCYLRVIGYGDYSYDRQGMVNDQWHPGETYVIPSWKGNMVRAKCLDWFQPEGNPMLTVFVFELVK